MARRVSLLGILALTSIIAVAPAHATGPIAMEILILDTPLDPMLDPAGLQVTATFTLETPTLLVIELTNSSTGVPEGFSNSDQILTGISFDLGMPWINAMDPVITGGSARIGDYSYSLNFDNVPSQLGPGDDVSGEWGYSNSDGTGMLPNFVSANEAHITPFGGPNLDGPVSIDGPQGGLVADPPLVPLGGLGAISDTVIIELSLSQELDGLGFLYTNGVIAEFGSDAAFLRPYELIPEPSSIALVGIGSVALLAIRKRS